MIAFIIRRLLQSVLVMLTVLFVAYSLFAYVGDPVGIMLGQDYKPEDRTRLEHELGLDQPFVVQFAKYVGHVAQGNFGISYRLARPVDELILERLPATLELSFVAAVLALVIGVPMGVYTGLHRDSWLSRVFMSVSLIGVSLPTFLIGILLILSVLRARCAGCPRSGAATSWRWAGGPPGYLTVGGPQGADPAVDHARRCSR